MGIPQEQKFDVVQFKQDKASYDYWFRHQFGGGGGDEDVTQKISNTIYAAVRLELSEIQRKYFVKYYFEGLTMAEIAEEFGTNKSTVSRTLARARKKLERVLKYIDPRLMRLFEKTDTPKKVRQNMQGRQRFKTGFTPYFFCALYY